MTNIKILLPNQSKLTLSNGDVQTVSVFESYPIRAIIPFGCKEVFIVGTDLGAPLDYADVKQSIRTHVDKRDRKLCKVASSKIFGVYKTHRKSNPSRGKGLTNAICLNQSGLNALIIHSHKPKAKKIQRFLTKEVMPEIFNAGEFKKRDKNEMLDTFAEMFSGGATSEQQRKIVEQLAEEQPEITESHQTPLLIDEAIDIEAMFKMAEIAVAGGHNEIYQAIMRRSFKFAKGGQ